MTDSGGTNLPLPCQIRSKVQRPAKFFLFQNIFNANQRLVTLDVREQRPLINVRTMDDACLRVRVIQVRDWPVVRVEGSRLLIGQCQLIFPNLLAAKQRLYGS